MGTKSSKTSKASKTGSETSVSQVGLMAVVNVRNKLRKRQVKIEKQLEEEKKSKTDTMKDLQNRYVLSG